jgi:hypothetical protein
MSPEIEILLNYQLQKQIYIKGKWKTFQICNTAFDSLTYSATWKIYLFLGLVILSVVGVEGVEFLKSTIFPLNEY